MRNASTASRQRGGVMILVALSGAILIGFLGIVVDLGRLYVTKTELQSAMDACALAAAAELKADAQAIERAVSAGITAGNRNAVGFQAASANVTAADILFSDRLSDNSTTYPFGYVANTAANPTTATYALCARAETGIVTWFMQVLQGLTGSPVTTGTVGAWATATLVSSQINCALPIGLCKLPAAPSTSPLQGLVVGQWVTSKLTASATGSFDWIDFNPGEPTPGCAGGGANELACIIKGQGQCSLAGSGTQVGEQGNIESLNKAWNTRFGLYKGGETPATAPPDFTGHSYNPTSWPTKFNAYGGSGATQNFQTARAGHMPYQGDALSGITLNGYTNSSNATLQASGADRRIVTVPVVDCTSWAASTPQTVPILDYACVLMLHPLSQQHEDGTEEVWLEYRGAANSAASPCSTSGLAGGTAGPLVPALVH